MFKPGVFMKLILNCILSNFKVQMIFLIYYFLSLCDRHFDERPKPQFNFSFYLIPFRAFNHMELNSLLCFEWLLNYSVFIIFFEIAALVLSGISKIPKKRT